jgi:hypothetical protein
MLNIVSDESFLSCTIGMGASAISGVGGCVHELLVVADESVAGDGSLDCEGLTGVGGTTLIYAR